MSFFCQINYHFSRIPRTACRRSGTEWSFLVRSCNSRPRWPEERLNFLGCLTVVLHFDWCTPNPSPVNNWDRKGIKVFSHLRIPFALFLDSILHVGTCWSSRRTRVGLWWKIQEFCSSLSLQYHRRSFEHRLCISSVRTCRLSETQIHLFCANRVYSSVQ